MRTPFVVDAITHTTSGLVFKRSITIQPQTGGAPAFPNFAGFLSMTLKKNDQIGRGNMWGRGLF